MGVKIPERDGLKASEEIRRLWAQCQKLWLITAYALAGDREKCLETGMDGSIAKPAQKGDILLRS